MDVQCKQRLIFSFYHDKDGKHYHKTRKGRHHGLILPAGTDQQLVQDSHDNTDRCNFEHKVDLQVFVLLPLQKNQCCHRAGCKAKPAR